MAETMADSGIKLTPNGSAIAPKSLSSEQFKGRFEQLIPLICQEWTPVTSDELAATEGDLDLAVDLIAEATDHTKTLIRCQIAELHSLSLSWERQDHEKSTLTPANSDEPNLPAKEDDETNPHSPSIDDVLDLLERRTEKLVERVKADVLPEVKSQAKRNLGASILTALGIGFLLGLFVGGSGGDRK